MKRIKLLVLAALGALCLTSCENLKGPGGNEMVTGSKTYYYALVHSKVTETRYYHIKGWAEYGPEGGSYKESYVGIELQLQNGDVIYRYEPNLCYELTKNRNENYVLTYGLIGD